MMEGGEGMNKLDEKILSTIIDINKENETINDTIIKIKHAVLSEIEKMEYTQIIDKPEYEKWINIENIRKLLGDKYE